MTCAERCPVVCDVNLDQHHLKTSLLASPLHQSYAAFSQIVIETAPLWLLKMLTRYDKSASFRELLLVPTYMLN